jgi:hypothetical protein
VGFARVLVTLAPGAAAAMAAQPETLSRHFVTPEHHQVQFAHLALFAA